MTWLYAFLLTAAIELPIVALLAGRVTHPIAWFLVRSMEAPWLVVEIGVFVAECLIYRQATRMPWLRAVAAALLANGITAALSFVV